MILYKDIFTDFDVFTDAYKVELVDDLYYKIHGKYIMTDLSIDDNLIGANKSAEDESTEEEDNKILVANVVHGNRLEIPPSIVQKLITKMQSVRMRRSWLNMLMRQIKTEPHS